MKKGVAVVALVAITIAMASGCNRSRVSSKANLGPAGPAVQKVTIQSVVPYDDPENIALNIRNECRINQQLADYIRDYSQKAGIDVNRKDNPKKSASGNVLIVKITNAVSSGGVWRGHNKYTQVKGDLYKDGKKISSFRAGRSSGGGAFGGYKGSCSVLGRTVRTLGSDISKWLQRPVDKARMGDM